METTSRARPLRRSIIEAERHLWRYLRFWNHEVLGTEGALEVIGARLGAWTEGET